MKFNLCQNYVVAYCTVVFFWPYVVGIIVCFFAYTKYLLSVYSLFVV